MKKIILTLSILIGFSAICFGNSTSYSSEYKTPILKTALDFHATYANGKVSTNRANINVITTSAMKRYKVVKSATNHTPVYPEDGYITAISDRNQVSFIETDPANGTRYYRVCAIMEDMNRYCSNVVELTINKTETTTTTTTTPTTTTTVTPLTSTIKTMIDGIVTSFMEKLAAKYPTSIAARITVMDALITKIEGLIA